MRIFNFFKPKQNKRFVTEVAFINNRDKQSRLAVETLIGLRELNVEEGDSHNVEFLFKADSLEKICQLADALRKLDYTLNDTDNESQFVIIGQTAPIKMMHETLKKWAFDMCALGYEHDCHFERWHVRI